MKTDTPRPILLKDYRPPGYLIDSVRLDVTLHKTRTRVQARLKVRPNPAVAKPGPLRLDGELLDLESIKLDGRKLTARDYTRGEKALVIPAPPKGAFELETVTYCNPDANKALTGLYVSKGIYCTQCEAQGFRRITYFLDRPDVLATYTVRIEADREEAPVLLANGNPVERGTLDGGKRHYAVWRDPHPKPSYLFALVGGNLASIASDFTTASGRKVDLRIYVEPGKEGRCAWAMDCLKRSMRWDEERFGREYDLDVFNIVAVSDFNMGAMENKGLNIFNDALVLASPETATDFAFFNIERVIAHEYFHNWTGNRITCRDWFQLCLKEGLTVFRDQEFSADTRSRAEQRIAEVRTLKARQFPEDAGPLAHPVRPSRYIEINNFYTATVYEKGAELVRMLQTLLGRDGFRKGMDLYFERHDGQAATVEDFVACFAEVVRPRPDPVHDLVRPGRHAQGGLHAQIRRPQRERGIAPHPDPGADARRAHEEAAAHPHQAWAARRQGPRDGSRAGDGGAADGRARGDQEAQREAPLPQHRIAAGGLAAARLLGACEPDHRAQRHRAGLPDGA